MSCNIEGGITLTLMKSIFLNQSDRDVDVGRVIDVYFNTIMHLMGIPNSSMNEKWRKPKGVTIV